MARENLKGKSNLVSEIISTNNKDEKKKFQKSLVFDYSLKKVLEFEAKKRGMTVAGFIKYCVMKEIN